jgi:hypothetical protein
MISDCRKDIGIDRIFAAGQIYSLDEIQALAVPENLGVQDPPLGI